MPQRSHEYAPPATDGMGVIDEICSLNDGKLNGIEDGEANAESVSDTDFIADDELVVVAAIAANMVFDVTSANSRKHVVGVSKRKSHGCSSSDDVDVE